MVYMNNTATTTATTCTVVVTATGGRCGAPAVTGFTGSNGEAFGECAHHAAPVRTHAAPVAIGDLVEVLAYGRKTTGQVVKVGKVNVRVEVLTYGGKGSRVITRPLGEVTPV